MKSHWNRAGFKYQYESVLKEAKRRGYSDEELESPYLDKLSHQTKSPRIMRMVSLAYYLGWLRGIESADNGLTPVTLDEAPPTGNIQYKINNAYARDRFKNRIIYDD